METTLEYRRINNEEDKTAEITIAMDNIIKSYHFSNSEQLEQSLEAICCNTALKVGVFYCGIEQHENSRNIVFSSLQALDLKLV